MPRETRREGPLRPERCGRGTPLGESVAHATTNAPAAPGGGAVDVRTADCGGASFNGSHRVPRALCDAWALSCVMVMVCVKEVSRWGMRACAA